MHYEIIISCGICGIVFVGVIVILTLQVYKLKKENQKSSGNIHIMGSSSDDDELSENYLVDFRADRFSGNGWSVNGTGVVAVGNSFDGEESSTTLKTKMTRIPVKPVDVLNELQKSPTNWSLEGLEDKIGILRDKEEIITQKYAKQEVKALILCLENRKKYDVKAADGITFREYFSRFDITDEAKIKGITDKHDLKMGKADIFIPEFPDDAVKIMKEYGEKVKEICDKKPRFFVIAQEKDFKEVLDKRDPILLAQSPFGFYYFILGAWDSEMLYLPEL